MRMLVHRLASMKIAVTLLVALLVAMAAGTIVESAKGSETAYRVVYYAWWFQLREVLAAHQHGHLRQSVCYIAALARARGSSDAKILADLMPT